MNANEFKLAIITALAATIAPIVIQYYAYIEMAALGLGALAIGSIVIGVTGALIYGGAELRLRYLKGRTEVDLMRADVDYREAQRVALLQQVTAIKPGHHAIITHANHPLQVVSYAVPQLALPDKVGAVNQLPSPSVEADIFDSIRTGVDWIKEFLFNEDGSLKVHHVSVSGPTGVGKTYFMLYMMWLLQQPHPAAEYWLLDPKFEGEESGWPFDPIVTDFDEVPGALEYLYVNVVTTRKHNKRMNIMPPCPAFFIIDEVDGCFSDHKAKFTDPLKKIIKESRSGWGHCFIAGQSSLVGDSGLNGSIYRNMARFVMGTEALAFTRNAQFTFWEKADRDIIAKQLIYLQREGRRAVLVIPPSGQGLPFVGEIPNLPKPDFNQAAPVARASKLILDAPKGDVIDISPLMNKKEGSETTKPLLKSGLTNEQEKEICDMYREGYKLEQIAGHVIGNKGGKQNLKILNVLVAHEVELSAEHATKLANELAKKTT